jgi:nicotinamidase-related amidase
MLIDRESSALLVIDVQERLLPHIHDWQRLFDNILWTVRVAQRLNVPVMASEQYPKGIGPTRSELRALLPQGAIGEKMHFSCTAAQCLEGLPGSDRRQLVVCGIESHVCVLQTVLDLRCQGREVFVVADAIGSRDPMNRELAMARMRSHAAEIVSREMVAVEWLKQAGTAQFRSLSAEFLR